MSFETTTREEKNFPAVPSLKTKKKITVKS
jgi:hypothetical protein